MRYDTLVTLVFAENSGKIGAEQTEPEETKIFSTITRYEKPVTYIIVNGSKYNVEKRVNYDKTSTFYIVKQKGSGHG